MRSQGKFQYRLSDPGADVEDLEDYKRGGLHPIELGQRLGNGRFRVVHKLGYGGYGTVWACEDRTIHKWRAVKIIAADWSTEDCAELKMLEMFKDVDRKVLEENHILLPLEHFWEYGPNGRHLGLVMPLLGSNILRIAEFYGHCDILIKDICYQMTEALRFLHSRGLCHGDFRPENILLRIKEGIDGMSEEELLNELNRPYRVPIHRVKVTSDDERNKKEEYVLDENRENFRAHMPRYLVEPAVIQYGSGLCSTKIAVTDFGVAFDANIPQHEGTGIPKIYASPEELLLLPKLLRPETDIWSLGIAICKVRAGILPFCLLSEGDDLENGMYRMECVSGPVPPPFRNIWKEVLDGRDVYDPDSDGFDSYNQKDVLEERERARRNRELLPVSFTLSSQEKLQQEWLEERGEAEYLKYCMAGPKPLDMCPAEAANLIAQQGSGVLPYISKEFQDALDPSDKNDAVYAVIPKEELHQLHDLLMKMFRWFPTNRSSAATLLDHPWFQGKDKKPAMPGEPTKESFATFATSLPEDDDDSIPHSSSLPIVVSPPASSPREALAIVHQNGGKVLPPPAPDSAFGSTTPEGSPRMSVGSSDTVQEPLDPLTLADSPTSRTSTHRAGSPWKKLLLSASSGEACNGPARKESLQGIEMNTSAAIGYKGGKRKRTARSELPNKRPSFLQKLKNHFTKNKDTRDNQPASSKPTSPSSVVPENSSPTARPPAPKPLASDAAPIPQAAIHADQPARYVFHPLYEQSAHQRNTDTADQNKPNPGTGVLGGWQRLCAWLFHWGYGKAALAVAVPKMLEAAGSSQDSPNGDS